MIDLSDAHIYGGLVLLAFGLSLIHIGIGVAVLGAGLMALGAWYSRAEALAAIETDSEPGEAE